MIGIRSVQFNNHLNKKHRKGGSKMSDNKRTYYRNWYQHWQMEKVEEEKLQAKKYFSEIQEEETPPHLEVERYQINHDQSRKYTSSSNRGSVSISDGGGRNYANANVSTTASGGVLRGATIVIPLLLVVLTLMYSVGFIPQTFINRNVNGANQAPVMAYIAQHDEIMILHNEINQSLERHVPGENVTSEFEQELKELYDRVVMETDTLMEQSEGAFANINRLWTLKLTSLDEMVESVLNQEEMIPELMVYYHQFVEDQNEIGKQMSLALAKLLSEYNIEFIEQVNGDIELVS